MTTGAIVFMVASWTGVLSLTIWAFYRLLTGKRLNKPV